LLSLLAPLRHRRDDAAVPFGDDAPARPRRGRGSPRTPLPLLPIIAVAAGIGVAYVAQTAHATQSTYEATSLAADQTQLRQEDQRLGDELGRLRSAERIVSAAHKMGMRPASQWSYVAGSAVAVVPPSSSANAAAVAASRGQGAGLDGLIGDVLGSSGGSR
jgi:hypothetical protein